MTRLGDAVYLALALAKSFYEKAGRFGMEGTSAVLARAAKAITNLYLESADEVRTAIETGFLEHALETTALQPYFEHWASDSRLRPAWNRALEWGKAHPDYMAKLYERLSKAGQE